MTFKIMVPEVLGILAGRFSLAFLTHLHIRWWLMLHSNLSHTEQNLTLAKRQQQKTSLQNISLLLSKLTKRCEMFELDLKNVYADWLVG